MSEERRKMFNCPICQQDRRMSEAMHVDMIRGPVVALVRKKCPNWSPQHPLCLACLNRFRADYAEDVLETDKGELSELEAEVIQSLRDQDTLASNLNEEFDRNLTFGQRFADKIAVFGGSWTFIGIFSAVLFLWMGVNLTTALWRPFDPFPFIFLNLILSCLAAIQAPIIMMSQNRQSARDRLHAEHDYRVNLKAELEIRHLTRKVDQLMTHQWQRLLELQQVQLDLMDNIGRRPRH